MQYGTCRVPLVEMCRQGRSSVIKAKECDIASYEAGDRSITGAVNMGSIQVLISNIGKHEAVQTNEADDVMPDVYGEKDRVQPSQKPHKYKKHVKSKPINLVSEELLW